MRGKVGYTLATTPTQNRGNIELKRVLEKVASRSARLVILIFLAGLTACVGIPKPALMESARVYLPEPDDHLLNRFAPVFWIENYQTAYNRPGAVQARSQDDIVINPDTPAMYVEQRQFETAGGEYTNLLYRVHFREIPDGFSPYYLGAGKNIGLFVVVTLDANGQPLLITTVHTCGCYLAFIPTSNLPLTARPPSWNTDRQSVYGENLPGLLDYGTTPPDQLRVQLRIRPDTHRVMDLWLDPAAASPEPWVRIPLHPLEELKHLPLKSGGTTSFYETKGCRAGHVKGSFKSRERLFMSWWTLAWTIGQDKYLGTDKNDGPVFYTSLLPWARKASDMRDFASFLRYWGWNL